MSTVTSYSATYSSAGSATERKRERKAQRDIDQAKALLNRQITLRRLAVLESRTGPDRPDWMRRETLLKLRQQLRQLRKAFALRELMGW